MTNLKEIEEINIAEASIFKGIFRRIKIYKIDTSLNMFETNKLGKLEFLFNNIKEERDVLSKKLYLERNIDGNNNSKKYLKENREAIEEIRKIMNEMGDKEYKKYEEKLVPELIGKIDEEKINKFLSTIFSEKITEEEFQKKWGTRMFEFKEYSSSGRSSMRIVIKLKNKDKYTLETSRWQSYVMLPWRDLDSEILNYNPKINFSLYDVLPESSYNRAGLLNGPWE